MVEMSTHAIDRAAERTGTTDPASLFEWLWNQGRGAIQADFWKFNTRREAGREYRVCRRGHCEYMVVRDIGDNRFITLLKRGI